jgi:ketosteroid isomerase-like protein
MNTSEVVHTYFECVNSARWDDYVELFDEHIIMEEQLAGHIEGKAAVAKSIEGLRTNKTFRNVPQDFVVEGDKAMVTWHISFIGPKGVKIEAKGVNFFRVKDGKIVYFANFHDTAPFKPLFEA